MVWLVTRYWWSKRSDHVLQNTIAHDKINLYGKKNPPQIRINRVFVIRIYRKMGSFYRPNPNTVLITITPSRFTSTSRGIYSIFFQPINISISNCLYPFWVWHEIFTLVPNRIFDLLRFVSPIYKLTVQMAYPMRTLEEDICFVEMGWFPNWILVKFRFCPNF